MCAVAREADSRAICRQPVTQVRGDELGENHQQPAYLSRAVQIVQLAIYYRSSGDDAVVKGYQ